MVDDLDESDKIGSGDEDDFFSNIRESRGAEANHSRRVSKMSVYEVQSM